MSKRYQISTSISRYTKRQIDRLRSQYGTIREVITRAVELLDQQTNNTDPLAYDPETYDIQRTEGQSCAELGSHLWALAGDMSILEADEKYGGLWRAAKEAAAVLGDDVTVLDVDGEPMDNESLIHIYLTAEVST
jgi:hypothetical protein